MAKQNVTFVERHVEKIVIGVTGTVLLATVVLYLVGAPHQATVQGEDVGPRKLYGVIRTRAEDALRKMRQAQPDPQDGSNNLVVPNVTNQLSPYDLENIPKEFPVAFATPGPNVPMIKGAQRGKIRLAEILPPKPIKVTTGKASARLTPPVIVTVGPERSDASFPSLTQDWNWVAIFSAVHRKAQRAKFEQAQYAFERMHMLVAGVEAERQERLPDGQWGEGRVVTGYSERVVPVRRTAELIRQDNGTILVSNLNEIDEYKKNLDTPQDQAMVLRPPFQKFLECPLLWKIPEELPDLSIKWEEFEALVKPEENKAARFRPAAAGPATLSAVQLMNKGKDAIDKKEYLEAEGFLKAVETTEDANPRLKQEARDLLRQIQPEIERAIIEAQTPKSSDLLGPDVEPVWLTDLSVIPGKTYRYRLRLLVFNPYVGNATELENPEDAGKVVVESPWSDWSDPILVKPVSYLFYTTARPAKIEMDDWSNGRWIVGTRSDIQVGDAIAFNSARHDFAYDSAIVAGLNPQINYPERDVSRTGQISYQDKSTGSLVLITSDGAVEERIASVDLQRRKDLRYENKELDRLCEAFKEQEPSRTPAMERNLPSERRGEPKGVEDDFDFRR